MSGVALLVLLGAAIGAFCGLVPVWIITSVWWFRIDRGVRPLRLRLWRAVTWLPLTIRNRVRWGHW